MKNGISYESYGSGRTRRREERTGTDEEWGYNAGTVGKRGFHSRRSRRKEFETGFPDEEKALALKKELYAYQENGTRLSLNGRYASPERIVRACMLGESQEYMRDYISEEGIRIDRIDFTRIREK